MACTIAFLGGVILGIILGAFGMVCAASLVGGEDDD